MRLQNSRVAVRAFATDTPEAVLTPAIVSKIQYVAFRTKLMGDEGILMSTWTFLSTLNTRSSVWDFHFEEEGITSSSSFI